MSLNITTAPSREQLSVVEEPPAITPGKPSEPLEVGGDSSSAEGEIAEDESQYPTGLPFFLILVSGALVLILTNMNASIVSVAVPAITNHFHTVQDVGWYSAAFRLSSCSFQFMFGKLYKIFSVKRIFFISVVIFMAGSTLCAAAPTSAVFVFGRAICGFASAGIMTGCFTLLVLCLPMRKRPLYTGVLGSVGAVAAIAAPMLGGVIVDQLSWRWCFWIALPIGFVTLVGIFFCLTDVKPQVELTWAQRISQLDLIGNILFVPSLTCLFVALSWAGSKYAWNSPTVIGLFCTFGVLLGLFALDQYRKGDAAALPPRILKNRTVLSGFTYTLCCNSASMVIQYYLPTYYQAVRGYSASQSGYFQVPVLVGDIIGVLVQSIGVSIIGYYTPFMFAGSVLMPIFAGLLTTLTVKTALAKILVLSGIYGFAGGVGFLSPQSAVQMALPTNDASIGLSIILFGEQFGPAVFVSAAQSIFENRLAGNLHELVPSLNATSVEAMGLSDLKSLIGPEDLDDVLLGFDKSLSQTWYLAVALACITMVGSATMDWRSVKQKRS
jgi:MFS family permease